MASRIIRSIAKEHVQLYCLTFECGANDFVEVFVNIQLFENLIFFLILNMYGDNIQNFCNLNFSYFF